MFLYVTEDAQCIAEKWKEYQGTALYKVTGTSAYFFITNHIAVDADGAPNAYHPDNIGLDWLANAGYPDSSWWKDVLVVDPDNPNQPYIQKTGPFAGYFISRTALEDSTKPEIDLSCFVDSTRIPYIVFPGGFRKMADIGMLGDLGFAINVKTGVKTGFVVADIGPVSAPLGEVSIRLAEKLGGKNVSPRTGAKMPEGDILYIVFPFSARQYKWPLSADKIEEIAKELLDEAGGADAIRACADNL
jgi:hypothetical protein